MIVFTSSQPFGAFSAAPRFSKPRNTSSIARFLDAWFARKVARSAARSFCNRPLAKNPQKTMKRPPMLVRVIDKLIFSYQKTISPDHGLFSYRFSYGFCRFSPSCSSYARQALQEHSLKKALFLIIRRLLRCNPFASMGYDPIPQKPAPLRA